MRVESESAQSRKVISELRDTALKLLARREHSRFELSQKLQKISGQLEAIEFLLDELSEKNYLSDLRFAESYIRMRMHKGMGPVRIRHELRQRGVDEQLIAQTISQAIDWEELLQELCEKRQHNGAPLAKNEHEKQIRFWLQRGFDYEQIRRVLSKRPV